MTQPTYISFVFNFAVDRKDLSLELSHKNENEYKGCNRAGDGKPVHFID